MRTKLNLDGSNRRVAAKLGVPSMSGMPHGMPSSISPARIPAAGIPMEWLDAGSWRLPSGKALAEFALQAGFLAPMLFKAERFGNKARFSREASLGQTPTPSRSKHFGRGSNR